MGKKGKKDKKERTEDKTQNAANTQVSGTVLADQADRRRLARFLHPRDATAWASLPRPVSLAEPPP